MPNEHLPDEQHETQPRSVLGEIFLYSVIAMAIVLPVRIFIAQPFIVSGTSMVPTFEPRDYLVIDKVSYRMEEPKRGDVIIFRYPLDARVFFVKRIIGLPGERVRIEDNVVTIEQSDGTSFTLDEPYLHEVKTKSANVVTKLSDKEYFVMGDNRPASSDSRVWGQLHERFIIGRAFTRLFPFSNVTLYPGTHTFSE